MTVKEMFHLEKLNYSGCIPHASSLSMESIFMSLEVSISILVNLTNPLKDKALKTPLQNLSLSTWPNTTAPYRTQLTS
jgi:hypothetical protein